MSPWCEVGYAWPGGAAQDKSGVACLNKIPCGMGGLKFTDCVECVPTKWG